MLPCSEMILALGEILGHLWEEKKRESKWKGYTERQQRTVKFWTVALIYILTYDRWSKLYETLYQLASPDGWPQEKLQLKQNLALTMSCHVAGVIMYDASSWNLDEIWMKFGWFHPCLFVCSWSHASIFFLSFFLLVLWLEVVEWMLFSILTTNERQVHVCINKPINF
jgi:hypothetical protein